MKTAKYHLAAITAFFIWGFFSVPLKFIAEFNAFEILFFRLGMAVILLVSYLFIFDKKGILQTQSEWNKLQQKKKLNYLMLSLGGGMLLTFNWLIFIYIVNEVNVKTASFSYLICPVITAIMGYVVLKEQLTKIQWLAVALCVISCYLIGKGNVSELGFSLVTALSYATYLVTQRKNTHFDRIIILAIQLSFSFILFVPLYLFFWGNPPTEPRFYLMVLLIASVFTVLPLFLNLFALKELKSATIGIMMYLNPIIGFFLGLFVFKEPLIPIQGIGYLIILVALVIFNFNTLKQLTTK